MQNKISTAEAILLIMVGLVADLINWVPIVNWVVAIFMFPITQIYFRMKGIRSNYSLISNLIELIPIVSVLPAYTIAMVATIYVDRHPELLEKVSKMAAAKTVNKGNLKPSAATNTTDAIKKA